MFKFHVSKVGLSILLLLMSFTMFGQNLNELWKKENYIERSSARHYFRKTTPTKYTNFELNLNLLKNKLTNIPQRKGGTIENGVLLSFPTAKGTLQQFQVVEASIMDEKLQNEHPNIRSYIGKSLNSDAIIRFSVTPVGFHGMILEHGEATVYIDPKSSDTNSYLVYSKTNLPTIEPFVCKFDEIATNKKTTTNNTSAKETNANDGVLRTFRLAIATTGEYSQFHLTNQGISASATEDAKKTAVLSAIVTTMTRVNGIFERDVALTMVLVATNKNIIFLDAVTDGFTNDDSDKLIDESQTKINAGIGFSNYDIGHTFSTGGGGLAQLNSPCTTYKARGITGSGNPIGDAYDIDYVAHEMGHQFGAHHTFNGDAGNCGGGNRNNSTAVEPGSGSTIMGYAGICSPQNVQNLSDDYFHLVSIREMWNNISAGNSTCSVKTTTTNSVPVIESLKNYTLPVSTPFVLSANATDANGDNLTYTWEQLDTEITTHPLVNTATAGPAFRSVKPSTSSKRYFPAISTVLAGNLQSTWEVLPSVSRTMKFGVTVRDNFVGSGQTASKETTLTFDATAGPFKVTSQSTAVTWDAGTAQTITWDVANTKSAPVNCSFVNILFSSDGGLTYPTTLASNIENNGSYIIVAPLNGTTQGKIKVESVGNVFYAINASTITVQASEFVMNFQEFSKETCLPESVTYNFTYSTFLGFNEETTFSASNLPEGATVTFNPSTAKNNNTAVQMTISNLDVNDIGTFNISVTGTSATTTKVKTTAVTLHAFSSVIQSPSLVSPNNNAVSVLKPYQLTWNTNVNAAHYVVEISTSNTFSVILESATVVENSYNANALELNTNYFWRVKSVNNCGESAYSSIYNFTTANEVCGTVVSEDTPVAIPDNDETGISSSINVFENKIITDINVTVNITHPWVGDLTLKLISPSGTTATLAANLGDEGDGYVNTVFDDDATSAINLGVAPFTGTFSPQENLSKFLNEESYGKWQLLAIDEGPEDIGSIDSWSIEICGVVVISDDDDKDGVKNDVDQCPNTPLGEVVDATGCPSFTLPATNFSLTSVSETCPGKNNGQLTITAQETHTYVATINGATHNFTNNNLSLSNLQPGNYNVCITVTGQTYEQCYTVTIAAGTTVSAKATVTNTAKVAIQMEQGTAPYTVFVNDTMILQTSTPSFAVAAKHGDLIEVKTAVDCEGVFSKTVDLLELSTVYPNPTSGAFEITLPVVDKEIKIAMYNTYGQLISQKTYPVISGKVQLSIDQQPAGLYLAKVYAEKPFTLKIVKK